ncbi:FAD-binding domain-containing protein [Pholiota conissans]|uniref:FAD-binding domain-containing protein n=1 Tax=Pholiota conissans TaxID=109636 RepID=A0A9P5Z174_9AGAR|nr:FAD-binding domain-containing protein [Pholiota conissans]
MFDSFPSPWSLLKLGTQLLLVSPLRSVSDEWASLNKTLGGRLQRGIPFAQPCFLSALTPSSANYSAQCTEIQERNEDHLFRSESFGSYELTQWETCEATGEQCSIDWQNPQNSAAFSPPRECKQGSVPSYYIEVKEPNDVRAAYAFTQRTKIPLVIKNTGHDYFGRSAGPGTLALWTRNLDKLVLDKNFVPEGCSSDATTALTIGAGQHFRAIYDFSRANNVTFVAGADPSVGASGGWVMGGGHGALSPAFGLGVDRVLQFKIVTPDGQYRTVNKCQNEDLFFALRGGGGGTFGVVLESSFIASPQVTVQAVLGMYNSTRENTVKLVKELAKGAVQLAADGWGGYITPSLSSAVWANPLLSLADAEKSAASVIAAFKAVGGETVFYTMETFTDFFDTFIAPNTDPVGRPQVLASRLIPSDKFEDDVLIESMINGMLDSDFSQILAVAPYGFKDYDKYGTSIHPAWRTSVWHSLMSYFSNFDSTLDDRMEQYAKLTRLWTTVREHTPNSGVYMNEADIYEPDYKTAFWGPHHDRLLEIKKKYDPHHILDCWRCVGWKGVNDDRYKCYPRKDTTATPEVEDAKDYKEL